MIRFSIVVLRAYEKDVAKRILEEINIASKFFKNWVVYLTLNRMLHTLSGGKLNA